MLLDRSGVMASAVDTVSGEMLYVSSALMRSLGIDDTPSGRERMKESSASGILRPDMAAVDHLLTSPDDELTVEEYSPVAGKFFVRRDSLLRDGSDLFCVRFFTEEAEPMSSDDDDELVSAAEALERERASRKNFLINMSHDLRSHLNSIMGLASIVRETNDRDFIDRSMKRMESSAFNMIALLDDILDMSGLESLSDAEYSEPIHSDLPGDDMALTLRDARNKSLEFMRSLGGAVILLAEDVDIHREIILAFLEDSGLVIDIAEDGQKAVDLFERDPERYALILMDVHMPKLGGCEAARRIRALPHPHAKSVPMIAMTANALTEDEGRSFASGMNGHITKPVDWTDLISLMAYHLRYLKPER